MPSAADPETSLAPVTSVAPSPERRVKPWLVRIHTHAKCPVDGKRAQSEIDLSYDPAQFEVIEPGAQVPAVGEAAISIFPRELGHVSVRGESGGLPAASLQLRAVGKAPVATQWVISMAMQDHFGTSVTVAPAPPHIVNLVVQ